MANDLGPLHFFERLLIEDVNLIKEIVVESLMFFDYSYTLDWHKGTYSFYDPEIQKPNTLYIASIIESKFKNETANSIAFIKNEFFSDWPKISFIKKILLRVY